ncbi:MAG: hypothetical protein JM57_00805 [Comamonadaceae bacterium BICA1-1]|nr:MAG: hypothetical protein JM57_00805 [Comamonadaceae bacterium BICA1-1]
MYFGLIAQAMPAGVLDQHHGFGLRLNRSVHMRHVGCKLVGLTGPNKGRALHGAHQQGTAKHRHTLPYSLGMRCRLL